MTILHVLEPFATGTTTAVISITRELTDCDHIVIHGCRNLTENAEKVKQRFPPEVAFVEWKHAGREISLVKDWKALRSLEKILKPFAKQDPKRAASVVVHLHSSKAGFLGRLACRRLGIKKVIYTPHCGAFLRTDISNTKRRLYRFLEKIGGSFGGRVVGCGPSEGKLYEKLGKNTTYVSNGVEIKKEKFSLFGNRQKNRNLIAFSGIASLQKDPALWNAVAAACAASVREAGFSFCWIGDGPEINKLDNGIITVTGWKSPEEVDELLDKTAIYFSASAWEGLPYGALEAMNSGCALLLRNVPGNRDLVVPGENGWLFNTRDEAIDRLTQMIKDRSHLAAMGKMGRKIAEQGFTLKQMGDGYRQIYSGFSKR